MDLRQTKVRNGWLLCWLAVNVCRQVIRAGPGGLMRSFTGMIIPLLLLFPFFYLRMLGAGDIKTLAVLGSFLGPSAILPCVFFTFLFGAVLSLFTFLLDGGFRDRMRYLSEWLQNYLQTGRRRPYLRTGLREESLHMTIPILMSVLMWAGNWF